MLGLLCSRRGHAVGVRRIRLIMGLDGRVRSIGRLFEYLLVLVLSLLLRCVGLVRRIMLLVGMSCGMAIRVFV